MAGVRSRTDRPAEAALLYAVGDFLDADAFVQLDKSAMHLNCGAA